VTFDLDTQFAGSLSATVREQGRVIFSPASHAPSASEISCLIECRGRGTIMTTAPTARAAYSGALDILRRVPTDQELRDVRASVALPPGFIICREKSPADL
jgi:hypothetical protein